MRAFGLSIGLAFQTFDDLLDRHGSAAHAGKDVGQDDRKVTLVTLLGSAGADARAREHTGHALAHLDRAGGVSTAMADYVTLLLDSLTARTAGGT